MIEHFKCDTDISFYGLAKLVGTDTKTFAWAKNMLQA